MGRSTCWRFVELQPTSTLKAVCRAFKHLQTIQYSIRKARQLTKALCGSSVPKNTPPITVCLQQTLLKGLRLVGLQTATTRRIKGGAQVLVVEKRSISSATELEFVRWVWAKTQVPRVRSLKMKQKGLNMSTDLMVLFLSRF